METRGVSLALNFWFDSPFSRVLNATSATHMAPYYARRIAQTLGQAETSSMLASLHPPCPPTSRGGGTLRPAGNNEHAQPTPPTFGDARHRAGQNQHAQPVPPTFGGTSHWAGNNGHAQPTPPISRDTPHWEGDDRHVHQPTPRTPGDSCPGAVNNGHVQASAPTSGKACHAAGIGNVGPSGDHTVSCLAALSGERVGEPGDWAGDSSHLGTLGDQLQSSCGTHMEDNSISHVGPLGASVGPSRPSGAAPCGDRSSSPGTDAHLGTSRVGLHQTHAGPQGGLGDWAGNAARAMAVGDHPRSSCASPAGDLRDPAGNGGHAMSAPAPVMQYLREPRRASIIAGGPKIDDASSLGLAVSCGGRKRRRGDVDGASGQDSEETGGTAAERGRVPRPGRPPYRGLENLVQSACGDTVQSKP